MDIKKIWGNILGIVTLGISKKAELKTVLREYTVLVGKYKLAKADGKITKKEGLDILDGLVDLYEALKVVI